MDCVDYCEVRVADDQYYECDEEDRAPSMETVSMHRHESQLKTIFQPFTSSRLRPRSRLSTITCYALSSFSIKIDSPR